MTTAFDKATEPASEDLRNALVVISLQGSVPTWVGDVQRLIQSALRKIEAPSVPASE